MHDEEDYLEAMRPTRLEVACAVLLAAGILLAAIILIAWYFFASTAGA